MILWSDMAQWDIGQLIVIKRRLVVHSQAKVSKSGFGVAKSTKLPPPTHMLIALIF